MNNRKGIILAGGLGTRLHPITQAISKQLIPIYNKPMIYYPLSILMLAGIRDIAIITKPEEQKIFQNLLNDGSQWGINFEYIPQPKPEGLAQAFTLSEKFINNSPSALVLGDNLFFGQGLPEQYERASANTKEATVFAYEVHDPERYGVLGFDENGRPNKILEKPADPPSNFAVTGLYFYDNQVVDIAKSLKPSPRGQYEITDVNKVYLEQNKLDVERMGRGVAWFDAGTHSSLLSASNFVQALEERQGLMVACLEEIAFIKGFIDAAQLEKLTAKLIQTNYGKYLDKLLKEDKVGSAFYQK